MSNRKYFIGLNQTLGLSYMRCFSPKYDASSSSHIKQENWSTHAWFRK